MYWNTFQNKEKFETIEGTIKYSVNEVFLLSYVKAVSRISSDQIHFITLS